ncbi:MAG: DNA replication/repair protein RecF [Bacteroidetes bacterium]|nr:DNA replication/repair protein RecF [Bacteroidota bacterium]
MFLQRLTLTNFKNYTSADLSFSEKINCFVGDNGVGKTNLLDAIYYLSFCKSYFNSQDMQNIRHEEEFFAIHGHYLRNGDQPDVVSCLQRRNQKKQFRLNKKEYDRLADHIGLIPLVMVSPSDADLINLGSEERRKYIDGVISQFDKLYLDNLLNYNKALQQRNSLLRQMAETNTYQASVLEMWDHQMVNPGKEIHQRRSSFLERFIPLFQQFFEFISEGKEKVDIVYESQLNNNGPEELLKNSVSRDLALRFTTTGIHKDDLVFAIGGFPVKKFGSQGQQKSFLVALKLAQFEFTRRIKGYKPVLLFDDVFDKLDEKRAGQLIKLVGEDNFGQVFITDTHFERIKQIFNQLSIDHRIFHIHNGLAAEVK